MHTDEVLPATTPIGWRRYMLTPTTIIDVQEDCYGATMRVSGAPAGTVYNIGSEDTSLAWYQPFEKSGIIIKLKWVWTDGVPPYYMWGFNLANGYGMGDNVSVNGCPPGMWTPLPKQPAVGTAPRLGSSAAVAQAVCRDQGLVARHVRKRVTPRHWACVAPPRICKKAQELKRSTPAAQRRCNKVLRNWLR